MSVADCGRAMSGRVIVVLLAISSLPLRGSADGPQPQAVTLPSFLSLDAALQIFRQRGFDLLLAEAEVRRAEADVRTAAAVPNPAIGLAVGKSFNYHPNPSDCPSCSDVFFSIGLSDSAALFDTVWGKRRLRREIAERALAAARLGRADAERTLELTLRQQYLQAVLARDSLDFAEGVQKTAGKILELNQIRYRSGAISEADVAKVETAKLEADQDVDRATQELLNAKVALAFLLGARGQLPSFSVEQDLPKFRQPTALAGATAESLIQQAYALRPDLRALRKEVERAQLGVRAATRQLFPDLALSVQYAAEGYSTNAINPPTLTFGLQSTLPLFYQYQGERARARVELRQQQIGAEKLAAQVSAEVSGAFVAYESTRQRLERMESRLLERARRARDLIEIQYQKGAASLLEYLDAQRTFITTNLEYLRDLTDYWTAVYQLGAAVGMELR